MVTIAHRLSTIRDAQNIIVMSKGQIIEQGSHSELITLDGTYARLVKTQDLGSSDDDPDQSGLEDNKASELVNSATRQSETNIDDGRENSKDVIEFGLFRGVARIAGEQRGLWFGLFLALAASVLGGT